MRRRASLAGFLTCLSFGVVACSFALAARANTPRQAPGAAPVLVADKGKFKVVVDGKPAGKEEFEISASGDGWVARGTAEFEAKEAGASRLTSLLRLKADGTPVHYEWATEGAKKASATVDFSNGTAAIELHLESAKPFAQQFFFNTPRVVILDNNLFYQYAILARMYDWAKKGPQTFPVLVPQSMTPGSVTVEAGGTQQVGDKQLEMLRVRSEDLEIDLFLDNLKLVRVVSSTANAEAVRE